jgi:OTT_1508-like deaminase
VRPPAAEAIEVLSGSLDILNLQCSGIVSPQITEMVWDDVKKVYKEAQPGHPAVGKKKVKFTQHCEITLALDMLKRKAKFTHSKIEIGVSKACCEWCCDYLNFLASEYPQHSILVRPSHGKQPDGWMIPPDGPKSVTQLMAQSLEKRIHDVVREISSRRRSDSNELPSFTTEADMEDGGQDVTKLIGSFKS